MTRFMPAGWDEHILRTVFGLPPDTRTPAEKERDRAARSEESRAIVHDLRNGHASVLASATGLRRLILELHAPVFSNDEDRWPTCDGCDMEGYEVEAPRFPCRTYELARDNA